MQAAAPLAMPWRIVQSGNAAYVPFAAQPLRATTLPPRPAKGHRAGIRIAEELIMKDQVLATIRGISTHRKPYLFISLLLLSSAIGTGPQVSSAMPAGAQVRPNILYIMVDNQPASIVGAYGNPDVRTPNIDRLANEGIRLTRVFAVHGYCSPTRATLLTGLYLLNTAFTTG